MIALNQLGRSTEFRIGAILKYLFCVVCLSLMASSCSDYTIPPDQFSITREIVSWTEVFEGEAQCKDHIEEWVDEYRSIYSGDIFLQNFALRTDIFEVSRLDEPTLLINYSCKEGFGSYSIVSVGSTTGAVQDEAESLHDFLSDKLDLQ